MGVRIAETALYIFCDASLHWRNSELFVTSLDLSAQGSPRGGFGQRQRWTVACAMGLVLQWRCCGSGGWLLGRIGRTWKRRVRMLHVQATCASKIVVTVPGLIWWSSSDKLDLLCFFSAWMRTLLARPLQIPGWRHAVRIVPHRALTAMSRFLAWRNLGKSCRCCAAVLPGWSSARTSGWGALALESSAFPSFAMW